MTFNECFDKLADMEYVDGGYLSCRKPRNDVGIPRITDLPSLSWQDEGRSEGRDNGRMRAGLYSPLSDEVPLQFPTVLFDEVPLQAPTILFDEVPQQVSEDLIQSAPDMSVVPLQDPVNEEINLLSEQDGAIPNHHEQEENFAQDGLAVAQAYLDGLHVSEPDTSLDDVFDREESVEEPLREWFGDDETD